MYFAIWSLIIGALLITMALAGTLLRRLPLSTAMLYLAAGFGIGPAGLAVLSHTYGFLAVLAAGIALQRVMERPGDVASSPARETGLRSRRANEALATDSQTASAYLMQEVQGFNEQLERIAEVAIVLAVGGMLAYTYLHASAVWFVLVLLLVVRPVSVWVGLLGAPVSRDARVLISWFGIRGIGSIYYLMFAINHGLPRALAEELIALTLSMVAASIVVHGISVTPLMSAYARRKGRR